MSRGLRRPCRFIQVKIFIIYRDSRTRVKTRNKRIAQDTPEAGKAKLTVGLAGLGAGLAAFPPRFPPRLPPRAMGEREIEDGDNFHLGIKNISWYSGTIY